MKYLDDAVISDIAFITVAIETIKYTVCSALLCDKNVK